METRFYYEHIVTEHTKDILTRQAEIGPNGIHSDAIYVDIGMNIGWFSLWAATLGRNVIAFEPNPINYYRMCQSLDINRYERSSNDDDNRQDKYSKVTIYPCGVSNEGLDSLELYYRLENPGSGSIETADPPPIKANKENLVGVSNTTLITLDEIADHLKWFGYNDGKRKNNRIMMALLKVDVEDHGPEAILEPQKC